jgi:hypothetical protein
MEAIQHMQRLAGFGGKDIQVGPPHIATDNAQPLDHRWPQRLQAQPEPLLRAPLADPQEPPAAGIDLIDHGEEVVGLQAVSPVDLVHTNRFDPL